MIPAENPNTTCVVEIEVMSAVIPVELSDIVQSGAVAQALANVIVTDVSSVPITVIVPLLSLPDTVEVPPDMPGFGPDVIKCPVVSISKFGTPIVAVVEPTEKMALVEYVLPTPKNGLEAVVSILKTLEPAAFDTEKAFTELTRDCMANWPIGVVVPTPTKPVAARNRLLVAVRVLEAEK